MGLSIKTVNEVLENYNLGKVKSIKRLTKGYSNENYKITTSKLDVLYRIFIYNDKKTIKYELDLLKFLKKVDFPAAYPILNKNKKYINKTKNGNVVLYDFIEGKEPIPSNKTVQEIGTALGKLNSLKGRKKHKRKNPIGFSSYEKLIRKAKTATYKYPKIMKSFKKETKHLSYLADVDLPKGLIHADIFTDNTIFKNKKLKAILDFEEACTDTLMIEVGVAINGFCFKNDKLDKKLLHIFLTAYEKERPLTKKEKKLLPLFIQWGAHSMVCWHMQILLEDKSEKRLNRVKYLTNRVKYLRSIESDCIYS